MRHPNRNTLATHTVYCAKGLGQAEPVRVPHGFAQRVELPPRYAFDSVQLGRSNRTHLLALLERVCRARGEAMPHTEDKSCPDLRHLVHRMANETFGRIG